MLPVAVVRNPRSALAGAARRPSPAAGLLAVLATGLASALLEVLATWLIHGGATGFILSSLLPVLFPLFWLLNAWLVDAGAGLLGRSGRRGAFLAVSGIALVPAISYALLSLMEAVASRFAGDGLASALGWLTLPVLVWLLALMVLAITAVYEIPTLNAFALALLPYAAISGALLLLIVVLSALHGAGTI